MKKVVMMFVLVVMCLTFLQGANAKSLRDQVLSGRTAVGIIKYSTEARFHTSMVALQISRGPVQVENTIQRQNSQGNWTNRANRIRIVSQINQDIYYDNFDLNGVADTRTLWLNETDNSYIIGDFYINNGYHA